MLTLLGYLTGSTLDPAIIVPACIAGSIVQSRVSAVIAWGLVVAAVTALWRYPANVRFAEATGGQAVWWVSLGWVAASTAIVMGAVLAIRLSRRGD